MLNLTPRALAILTVIALTIPAARVSADNPVPSSVPCPPDIQQCDQYVNRNADPVLLYAQSLYDYQAGESARLQNYTDYMHNNYTTEQLQTLLLDVMKLSVYSGNISTYAQGQLLPYVEALPTRPAEYAGAVAGYGVATEETLTAYVNSLAHASSAYSAALYLWAVTVDENDGHVFPPMPSFSMDGLSVGDVPPPPTTGQLLPPPPPPPVPPAPLYPGTPNSPPMPPGFPIPNIPVLETANPIVSTAQGAAGAIVDIADSQASVSTAAVASGDGAPRHVANCDPAQLAKNDPNGDADGDGISNLVETQIAVSHGRFDPCNSDVDGDGISDGHDLLPTQSGLIHFRVRISGFSQGVEMDSCCSYQWGEPYIVFGATLSNVDGKSNGQSITFPHFSSDDYYSDQQQIAIDASNADANTAQDRAVLGISPDIRDWASLPPTIGLNFGLADRDACWDDWYPQPGSGETSWNRCSHGSPLNSGIAGSQQLIDEPLHTLAELAGGLNTDWITHDLHFGDPNNPAITLHVQLRVDGLDPCSVDLATGVYQHELSGAGPVSSLPSTCT